MKQAKMTELEKLKKLLSIKKFQEMRVGDFNAWLSSIGGIETIVKIGDVDYKEIDGHLRLSLKRDWSKIKRGEDLPYTEKCPFCGVAHLHGGNPGWRSAHCDSSDRKNIITTTGTLISSINGYYLNDINKG